MKFKVKIYRLNKGVKSKPSYFAVLEETFDIFENSDAILIKYGKEIFPTVIRKYGASKRLGFTIPKLIGRILENKTCEFELLTKNMKYKETNNENHLHLGNIIPSRTIRNFPLYRFELDRKTLLFWIYAKGDKYCILPKYISSENILPLLEIFGAFVCEGFKTRKYNKHCERLSFSNAEREQISWFIETVENILKIGKKEWQLQILFPETDSITISGLKEYWAEIGTPKENIDIVKNDRVSAKYGVCICNIYNSTLAEVFYSMMNYCKKISLNSKEYAISVFRGFSRGDLGISSRSISFDSEKKEDVDLFRQISKKLDVETSTLRFNPYKKGWWTCYITGRKNFEKLLQFDGIKHTNRRKKLVKTLLQNKKLLRYNYIKAVANNANTTIRSSYFLKRSVITTRFFLSKLEKEGYLNSIAKENQKKIYSLTAKGLQTFKFYNDLENELIEHVKTTNNSNVRAC